MLSTAPLTIAPKSVSVLKRDNNITQLDALHIACAEAQQVDRFITCDDRLIKRYKNAIIHLCNPVELVLQATQGESR